VTTASHRSKGYGAALMAWLERCAADNGCRQLHLDSGMQRRDAHRFYRRAGMQATGLHFALDTGRDPATD
jgi:GNAT superfamily N-acetyltransferase